MSRRHPDESLKLADHVALVEEFERRLLCLPQLAKCLILEGHLEDNADA